MDGPPGVDFMIPQNRLFDYYSVKSADFMKELALEVYRVVPLPAWMDRAPALRVKLARSGSKEGGAGKKLDWQSAAQKRLQISGTERIDGTYWIASRRQLMAIGDLVSP